MYSSFIFRRISTISKTLLVMMQAAKGDVLDEKSSQRTDCPLQFIEETGRLCPIHLGVVELEGDLEGRPEETASVSRPNKERIVENAAVHADCAVDVILCQSRCAYHHRVGKVVIPACLSHFLCEFQVLFIEGGQILAKRNVARTDFILLVKDDGIDGKAVELHQLASFGQEMELLDLARSFTYTPAHQHVKLQVPPFAELHEARHIERLEERHHRHRRFHPHLESISTTRLFRVDFLFHCFILVRFQHAKLRNSCR